jgi:hypothetical protein
MGASAGPPSRVTPLEGVQPLISQRGRDGTNDPPYTGSLGATRREIAHVAGRDGAPRRVEIVRGVNAVTDPALATRGLDGSLHRTGEVELAVPFLYHDPGTRHFALVVPPSLAHEELSLRADLLRRLAADTSEPLPAYVREARCVVGSAGLRKYLDESRASDSRAEVLAAREERLHKLAQELGRRQDELDALTRDLTLREQELEQRLGELIAREEALTQEEQVMRANMAALASRERMLSAREEEPRGRAPSVPPPPPEAARRGRALEPAAPAHDDELSADHVEELDPEETTGRISSVGVAPVVSRRDASDAEPTTIVHAASLQRPAPAASASEPDAELHPDEVAMVAEGDAEEAPEPEEAEEAEEVSAAPEAVSLDDALEAEPEPEGPALTVAREGKTYAAVVEGEVRVWFQGSPGLAQRAGSGSVVPVLQCDPDAAAPIALLSLRDDRDALARAVLDVTRPDDRAVLEALGRDFRVRAELVSPTGRALGTYAFGAPGEPMAQHILTLLSARAPMPEAAREEARARLLADGVAWPGDDPRPLLTADEQLLATAPNVRDALVRYEPFLDRARLDRACMALGLAPSQMDALGRRLVLAALRCGVVLSPALTRRAVELGLAADERALAARALTAFARTVEAGLDPIGRTPVDASQAWALLLTWADRTGAPIPDNVREAILSVYDPDEPSSIPPPDPRPAPKPLALAALDPDALTTWIGHPKVGHDAALLLADRDAPKHLAALRQAFRYARAEEATALAARLLPYNDALSDLWVELLASRRATLQHLAVAAVGALKLRRALSVLTQRATDPAATEWRLAGWAAGEAGSALVRAAGRITNASPERLAWMLAHAVRVGASREVERARADGDATYLEAATRALSLQDEARTYDAALRKGEGYSAAERLAGALLAAARAGA